MPSTKYVFLHRYDIQIQYVIRKLFSMKLPTPYGLLHLRQISIVMQFANNGDLYQMIIEHQKTKTFFQQSQVWSLVIQTMKGLQTLHQLKILHRDLKVLYSVNQTANIFLTSQGIVKLGDMNVSKVAKRGLCETQTGTPYYASPEVWKDQAYDSKSDIWSLGCVIYQMITLKPPFKSQDMQGLFKKVTKGQYSKIPSHFSQDLSKLIKNLLQKDPTLRPSCEQVLAMDYVQYHMNKNTILQPDQGTPELLKTIRIPKNLHYLTDKLPKPNYRPVRFRSPSVGAETLMLKSSFEKFEQNPNHTLQIHQQNINQKKDEVSQSITTQRHLNRQNQRISLKEQLLAQLNIKKQEYYKLKNGMYLILPSLQRKRSKSNNQYHAHHYIRNYNNKNPPSIIVQKIKQIRSAYKVKNNRYLSKQT